MTPPHPPSPPSPPAPPSRRRPDADRASLAGLAARLVRDRGVAVRAHRRRWILVALALVLAAAGYAAWRLLRPVPVPTDVVVFQRVGPTARPLLRQSGTVTYPRVVTVASTARAPVAALYAAEGQRVARGAVLARHDDRELAAQRAVQAVLLDDAAATLRRTQELHGAGAASEADLQRAQTAVDHARATLALTDVQLAQTVVRAPFGGLVVETLVDVGEVAAQGVCRLADAARTLVTVDVSQADVGRIGASQPAAVTLDAFPDVEYAARVWAVGAAADPARNTVPVRVEVLAPDAHFKPGLSARVFFVDEAPGGNRAVEAVLAVDSAAVGAEAPVWVVADGRVRRRDVQLGRRLDGGRREVVGGLLENERVVVGPARTRLREGERVAAE